MREHDVAPARRGLQRERERSSRQRARSLLLRRRAPRLPSHRPPSHSPLWIQPAPPIASPLACEQPAIGKPKPQPASGRSCTASRPCAGSRDAPGRLQRHGRRRAAAAVGVRPRRRGCSSGARGAQCTRWPATLPRSSRSQHAPSSWTSTATCSSMTRARCWQAASRCARRRRGLHGAEGARSSCAWRRAPAAWQRLGARTRPRRAHAAPGTPSAGQYG